MVSPLMSDRDGVIWLDGEFIDWRDANIHLLSNTLHYGLGVFEGIRAYKTSKGTAIFRLQDHTKRLFNSAHILNMSMPFTQQEINQASKEVVARNNLEHAYIRPMVFYGAESMGLDSSKLQTHVMLAAWEWPAYVSEKGLREGIKVRTSSYTRHHVNIAMTKAKANGNYMNSMLALREAIDSGCEEALLLDPEGYVSEGSGENIFIVNEEVIYTPAVTNCLDGITRKTIILLARELGYTVIEKCITRDEIYVADEAFFTGTAAEVLPIKILDGRKIGETCIGEVTSKLQSLYFDHVYGRTDQDREWLSFV